jgi:hypothetical protein
LQNVLGRLGRTVMCALDRHPWGLVFGGADEALGGAVLADHRCRLVVGRPRTGRAACRRLRVCGSGSEFPRRDLLEHVDVERLVRDELLQAGVLRLELLQPLRVVGLHPAVLREPAMPRRLRDLEMPTHLVELFARREEAVPFIELADDLLRRVPAALLGHGLCSSESESHNDWTTYEGLSSRTPVPR